MQGSQDGEGLGLFVSRAKESRPSHQTLHERQVNEVPERYVLPSERRPTRPLQPQQSLPVIDLAGMDDINQRLKTVSQIAQAAQEWGFFQVFIAIINSAFLFHFCVDYPTSFVIA